MRELAYFILVWQTNQYFDIDIGILNKVEKY